MSESLTLEEWRRARNVSQETMAKVCGIHVNTYRLWEKSPGEIRIDAALKIAEYLKISLETFILSINTKDIGKEENTSE